MISVYKVYSGSWETEVLASDYTDAVLIGTREQYMHLGVNFNIGFAIAVENAKTGSIEIFCPIAVFEDLELYRLARDTKEIFKALKP